MKSKRLLTFICMTILGHHTACALYFFPITPMWLLAFFCMTVLVLSTSFQYLLLTLMWLCLSVSRQGLHSVWSSYTRQHSLYICQGFLMFFMKECLSELKGLF